jgi:molecular chaperone DnaK (HSP70)
MSYIIGIDLGTTQSVLSYKKKGEPEVQILSIEQPIEANLIGKMASLPSFAFLPINEKEWTIGQYAAEQAAELPTRTICSAKSWLTHPAISPLSSHLPAGDLEEKLSPVETLTLFLKHLKMCFEKSLEINFDEQDVCVTVPASFDPQALGFVQTALEQANYPQVTFLEEPLASFYAWLETQGDEWRSLLKVGEHVLIVDIGGGTTDFTLISVQEEEGNLSLKRERVGKHLLLGGDNLDMACAHFAQQKLGRPLDRKQFQSCLHASRKAKEKLLSGQEKATIHLPGSGSSLIGGALKVEISHEELSQLIVEGFFPIVEKDEKPSQGSSRGLSSVSLPFVQDPRATAHLAQFLDGGERPDHVLFNGGTLAGKALQKRLEEQLNQWKVCKTLPGADLANSVAKGAVSYLQLKEIGGVRVKAGASRSYWIGIDPVGLAVPGFTPKMTARCLVPLGLEEGSEVHLEEPFTLSLGEQKEFRFFCSEEISGLVGEELVDPEAQLRELTPIHSDMAAEHGSFALVQLHASFTERGVLQVNCRSKEGKTWVLSFDTRQELLEPLSAF